VESGKHDPSLQLGFEIAKAGAKFEGTLDDLG